MLNHRYSVEEAVHMLVQTGLERLPLKHWFWESVSHDVLGHVYKYGQTHRSPKFFVLLLCTFRRVSITATAFICPAIIHEETLKNIPHCEYHLKSNRVFPSLQLTFLTIATHLD